MVDTRLPPHPFNGRQGVRNRIVLEALDRADSEKLFLLRLGGEGERQSDSEDEGHRDAKHDHEDSTVGQASWPVCARVSVRVTGQEACPTLSEPFVTYKSPDEYFR